MNLDGLYETIKKIIYEETAYLKHYVGQVVSSEDELKKGRVKVVIPFLGLEDEGVGLWCWPRQQHGLSVPAVDSDVEVYFMEGDSSKPVYLYPASERIDNNIEQYDGDINNHVIFESPVLRDYIKYHDEFGDVKSFISNDVDNEIYIRFDEGGVGDTFYVPEFTYDASSGELLSLIGLQPLSDIINSDLTETDGAPPIIISATAYDQSEQGLSIQAGDIVRLDFSESIYNPPTISSNNLSWNSSVCFSTALV